MRRGFTLIELLVASGVFLFGFTAALGLLLVGTRARAQADGMLRLSLAASSIVEEIRLEAGRETPIGPYEPNTYLGDGFAAILSNVDVNGSPVSETASGLDACLYPYKPQPGIWYRVIGCVDEKGDRLATERRADLATALRVDLLVVWNPVADDTLDIRALATRQGLFRNNSPVNLTSVTTPAEQDKAIQDIADFMAKRGFAVRETAWIIRKPSWER